MCARMDALCLRYLQHDGVQDNLVPGSSNAQQAGAAKLVAYGSWSGCTRAAEAKFVSCACASVPQASSLATGTIKVIAMVYS